MSASLLAVIGLIFAATRLARKRPGGGVGDAGLIEPDFGGGPGGDELAPGTEDDFVDDESSFPDADAALGRFILGQLEGQPARCFDTETGRFVDLSFCDEFFGD